jgi:hypothetical protein
VVRVVVAHLVSSSNLGHQRVDQTPVVVVVRPQLQPANLLGADDRVVADAQVVPVLEGPVQPGELRSRRLLVDAEQRVDPLAAHEHDLDHVAASLLGVGVLLNCHTNPPSQLGHAAVPGASPVKRPVSRGSAEGGRRATRCRRR